MSSNIRLVVRQGPRAGQVFELQRPTLSVGRSKDNDIQIDDAKISRRHASLTNTGAGYVVQDMDSTNGTFVNNRRITAPTPIRPGDVIGFGDSVIVDVQGVDVEQTLASAPAAAAPPAPAYAPPQPSYAPPAPVYTPPPPPPEAYAPEPQSHTGRNIAIGCGLLLAMLVCMIVAGFLVYQFAPAEIAGPICDVLRPLPLLGTLCQ